MNNHNYHEIINNLNNQNVWTLKQIKLELSSDQYIAILKNYPPNWETQPFGIMYNHTDGYFYTYRSSYVVGKYLFVKINDNLYSCSEMFDNPQLCDCMVIFECVREACRYNQVEINFENNCSMFIETERMN